MGEGPSAEILTDQLEKQRHTVSFDSYDMSVRELIAMVGAHEIDVAPEYQRHFVWDAARQSALLESIFLGIPIPPLFMATNKDGTWDVVDGVQRISTLVHFCGSEDQRKVVNFSDQLRLQQLTKLTAFEGKLFEELPKSIQLGFLTRPLRVTTLNDKSNLAVRFDLFERLNSGGVKLQPQEIRNCVYRGPFNDLLRTLSSVPEFRRVLRLQSGDFSNGTFEELVLRFFAFLEGYQLFEHSVNGFLNAYMDKSNKTPPDATTIGLFHSTFQFLALEVPAGIVRRKGVTPVNLYEAIAVGSALVLKQGRAPKKGVVAGLLTDTDLTSLTSGGTNSRKMVAARIEFVRDRL